MNVSMTNFCSSISLFLMLLWQLNNNLDDAIVFGYQLGTGGVGYIWSIFEGLHDEEWRHSVAPLPTDKLANIMLDKDEDEELLTQDGNVLSPSGELKSDTDGIGSQDDDNEVSGDDYVSFEKEVMFLTGFLVIVCRV